MALPQPRSLPLLVALYLLRGLEHPFERGEARPPVGAFAARAPSAPLVRVLALLLLLLPVLPASLLGLFPLGASLLSGGVLARPPPVRTG